MLYPGILYSIRGSDRPRNTARTRGRLIVQRERSYVAKNNSETYEHEVSKVTMEWKDLIMVLLGSAHGESVSRFTLLALLNQTSEAL